MFKSLLATLMVASFMSGVCVQTFADTNDAQAPLGWDFGIGLTSAPHGAGMNLGLATPAFHHHTNDFGVTNNGKLFFDWYQVNAKNFVTDGSGNLQTKVYHALSAGYRLSTSYKNGNVFMIDIGAANIVGQSDFTDRQPWGVKVGFGVAVPGYTFDNEGKTRRGYLTVRLDQIIGAGEANKITNKPEVFDGAYISVGILMNIDKIR